MKRQFTYGIVVALLVSRLFVGCRDAEADKALPKFAEKIVRQLIIDDINGNLEGYAEHKVMRRGDLHFAVVSTGVLDQHRNNSAVLIEAFRKYDMMDLKYEYGPRCLTVGEPITRKKVTTAVIHYRVPVITTVKENVPGYVLCDAMPNVDVDGAIKSLQAKLPEVAHDQFKLVELDTGDEQRDLFEGNVKAKWDGEKKKWVAETRSRQMEGGGEIDADEPNWGAVSCDSIDAAMKAKGFQKYNGRYVTDKALEYIRSKERGLTFRDGMWFDADLERQRIEEERLLRESLTVVKEKETFDSLAQLIRQTSEVKFANDALRRECMETITGWMDTIAGGDLPEEQTLDDFDRIPFLREWLSKIREEERWKRIGLESFAPSLEEKITRHERRLTEDLERFRMAYGCIAAGGQRPSATQAERLKSALMPMAQKAAYADAIRQAGKYITVVQAASDILAGNVTKANLAKLPTSAIARCEQCRGTGEKVCPECHNTRVCKLCHGSRFRVVEGLKSKNNPEGLRKIPCDPVCGACKNMAARKCSACNGSGHRLDTASIDEGLRTQAERTRESISKIISVLTAALGKEKKGDGSGNDER